MSTEYGSGNDPSVAIKTFFFFLHSDAPLFFLYQK